MAWWSNTENSNFTSVSLSLPLPLPLPLPVPLLLSKETVKYVFEKCYFKLGNKIFGKIIGIFYFTMKLGKYNIRQVKKFVIVLRFTDDLSVVNDGGEFK